MGKDNMYCGSGKIPKGKILGTPEYCVQTNQIRYYGIEKIDKDLLKSAKGRTTDLTKEQLKLKRLEDDAQILIKNVKKLKIILEDDNSKPSQLKAAQKRMDEIIVQKDKLIKKLKTQKKIVDVAIKNEKILNEKMLNEKNNKKKSSKSKSKNKKSSGSKSKKSSGSKSRKK